MGQIDIGEAVGAGWRIVQRKPLAVLAWGALPVALGVGYFLLFGAGIVRAVVAMARMGSASPTTGQILSLVGMVSGGVLLMIVGGTVIGAVIASAAVRAELQPEASATAYMRLGAQEGWFFASSFVMALLIVAAQIAMGIPVGVVTMIVAFSAAGGAHDPAAVSGSVASFVGIRLIGQTIITAVSAWLWLRLCAGPVMSFLDRKFHLMESWKLTRGHAWPMFLAMLLVYLMRMVIGMVFLLVAIAAGFMVLAPLGITPDFKTFITQSPEALIGAMTKLVLILTPVAIVASGLGTALTWASVARLYRQLAPEDEVASTFS